jgi:initiation factor 1A
MVKNTNGGNKSKGQARKNMDSGAGGGGGRVRKATEEGEVYAQVTKLLGGANCYVNTLQGKQLLCAIRGKFSGRNRRSNILVAGTWVLVGMRDWASEKDKCDLLEVYQATDKAKLRAAEPGLNWAAFNDSPNVEPNRDPGAGGVDDEIRFETEADSEFAALISAQITTDLKVGGPTTIQMDNNEVISIDDI